MPDRRVRFSAAEGPTILLGWGWRGPRDWLAAVRWTPYTRAAGIMSHPTVGGWVDPGLLVQLASSDYGGLPRLRPMPDDYARPLWFQPDNPHSKALWLGFIAEAAHLPWPDGWGPIIGR